MPKRKNKKNNTTRHQRLNHAEALEARRMLASDIYAVMDSDAVAIHPAGCACPGCSGSECIVAEEQTFNQLDAGTDLGGGHFVGDGHFHHENDIVELSDWKGEFYTPGSTRDHEDDPLTVILDFNDPGQANTPDGIGNIVSTFDVTSYGFSSGEFNTVANAVLDQVESHFYSIVTNNNDSRSPLPAGYDLAIEFEIGNVGTPPANGSSDYYYVAIGSDVRNTGNLGQAGLSTIRNSSGTPGVAVGSVIGSVFTDTIQTLGGLTPGNALSSGNLGFTVDAIAGTTSHEIGHGLSLRHLNKAGSTTPTGLPPIMGTGAIDLPSQDRINNREFAFSGTNSQAGGATQEHINQLVAAVGIHDAFDANDQIGETSSSNLSVPGTIDNFSISSPTDVDLFQISVSDGQAVGFDIDRDSGSELDARIRIFDDNGNQLATDDDGVGPAPESATTLDSYIEYRFQTGGTYYVGVSDYQNSNYSVISGNGDSIASSTTGDFTIIATDLGTDNNGTIATALTIPINTTRPPGSLVPSIDVDLHEFVVGANQTVRFELNNVQGNISPDMRLFDESGTQLESGSTAFDFTFADAGTYYLGVSDVNYDPITGVATNDNVTETGTYQLDLIDPDPNDQISEAFPGVIGATRTGFNIDSTNDVDMIRVSVAAGQRLGFDVDNQSGSVLDARVRLFDAAGTELANNDDQVGPAPEESSVESYVEFTFPTAGDYFFGVSHFLNGGYDPITGAGDSPADRTSTGLFDFTITDLTSAPLLVTSSSAFGDGLFFNGFTLPEAVEEANARAGADTIDFDTAGVFGSPQTITLAGSQLQVSDSVTINGTGADQLTISGGNGSRVFNFDAAGANVSVLNDVTVADGNDDFGGGIRVGGDDTLTVNRSTIRDNVATSSGGGFEIAFGATLNVNDSSIINNQANQSGAINIFSSEVAISNSTISGNTANFATALLAFGTDSMLSIDQTTMGDNPGPTSAVRSEGNASVTFSNSIFDSSNANFTSVGTSTLTSLGHNVSSDGTGNLTASGDQPNTGAMLAPLANNGGATLTHALMEGSPAMNGGDPAVSGGTDQTGAPRVIGGVVDAGAVEMNPAVVRVLGSVPEGASTQPAYDLREAEVAFYRFELDSNVMAASGESLSIDTLGTTLDSFNDTELGLYDAQGNLLADNDDAFGGRLSQLTFGDSGLFGDLSAGTYYLSISGFDTTFGSDFDVTSTSDDNGDLIVNFNLMSAAGVDADFNNDGLFNCTDVDSLVADIAGGTNTASFDLSGDGLVNNVDLTQWLADAAAANGLGSPYRGGDYNLDGVVDVGDFNIWNSNKFTMISAWCRGDGNADGSVDVGDFNIWNSNKFTMSDSAALGATTIATSPVNDAFAAIRMDATATQPTQEALPVHRMVDAVMRDSQRSRDQESTEDSSPIKLLDLAFSDLG